ncbi:hypothetical protein [Teredinibacter purpureus]|uniref:hypothetical protein n=1 Tax=Teredinibacter purpureus TaxID=2731756 RepID=UPI0005F83738|nr:hypothetical protein [Teredinibacter purpureus]
MRTFSEKYLGGSKVHEDRYKIDVIVLEKYMAFSTEILRLALLGIAVYGFLVSNIVLEIGESGLLALNANMSSVVFLFLGPIAFLLSSLAALAHRFYSSDCLAHYVRILRLSEAEGNEKLKTEKDSLEKDGKRCKNLIIASCIFLVLGTFLAVCSFGIVLNGGVHV